ncbi:MAG: FAD-dependent oxidoreductase [Rhizomicrobium sp.]
MAERYDAAVIGGGADGLAAAAMLARAGKRTILLERHETAGGRLATRQFHPGFYASPFVGDVAPIPDDLFWSLDLARHGALCAPVPAPAALWPERIVTAAGPSGEAASRRAAALAVARAPEPPPRWNPFAAPLRADWPPESWTHRSLLEVFDGPDEQAPLFAAAALEGRSADPYAAGSALHLLAPSGGGVWRGGLGGLGAALVAAATAAGAEIACGLEVSDIRCTRGRATALGLADGSEIAARAVVSTLDLKRTFLSLLAWSELPRDLVKQIGDFRIAGAGARLLVALAAPPRAPAGLLRRPLHVLPDVRRHIESHLAWRGGVLAEELPLTLRFESATDPGLAPPGAAVMGVTIAAVPHRLFDGVWTHDKRARLVAQTLGAVEQVFPGLAATVLATELVVPPDIENALGATAGDVLGGEIAPDQMFAFRPGFLRKSPYTPVDGLYLAGPSAAAAPLATCAAGAVAAEAVLADLARGKLP